MTKIKKFYKEEELVFEEKPKRYNFNDLGGQKFGRLTVLGFAGVENKRTLWFSKCECGNVTKADAWNLRKGDTMSCGCLHVERTRDNNSTHGHSRVGSVTPTYRTWSNMMSRCFNPYVSSFSIYGGRGITVCERWKNSFENFLEDMGEKPKGKSIERIDSNGNYEPGNCRWATAKEQSNNTSRNVFLTFNGKTQTIAQWAEEIGMSKSTLLHRVDRGWSAEKALTKKIGKNGIRKS